MSDVAKLFMKLTNSRNLAIAGESTTTGFPGWIELDKWNWSVATKDNKTAGQAPSAEPAVFTFGKTMDRSTTTMLVAMRNREPLKAVITLQDITGAAFELTVTLEEVRVIDYRVNGKNEKIGGQIDETWTFNYARMKFEFKPPTTTGSPGAAFRADVTRNATASTSAPLTPSEEILRLAERIEEREWDMLMPRLDKIKDASAHRPRQSAPAQPVAQRR